MATNDSIIGYTSGSLNAVTTPAPVTTATKTDSIIGFAVGTIGGTSTSTPTGASKTNSQIGFVTSSIKNPHFPVAVLTPKGLKYIPIYMWTGNGFQPPISN